jgi:hypothetical protein
MVRTPVRIFSLLLLVTMSGCKSAGGRDCHTVYEFASRPGEPDIAYASKVPAMVMGRTLRLLIAMLPTTAPKDVEYCAYVHLDNSLELIPRKDPPTLKGFKFQKNGTEWAYVGTIEYGRLD